MNDLVLPVEDGGKSPPPPSPDSPESQYDLTTIAGIDTQMRRVMEEMSNGAIDPITGNLLLKSFEIIRDGILKQLKLKNEEAFSATRKNEIDKEFEKVLCEFIDDYRRLKRMQGVAVKTKVNGKANGSANSHADAG